MTNKDRALQALTENPTIAAAARAADLSRQQLYTYLRDRDFCEALKRQRKAQAIERAEQLSAAREAAIGTLTGMMKDKDVPAAARIMAAKAVLQQAAEADASATQALNSADFDTMWVDTTLQNGGIIQ